MRTPEPVAAAADPRTRHAVRLLGTAAALAGVVVLAGWILASPSLTTFGLGVISMKANAAAGLVLLGASVVLATVAGARAQRAAQLLAAAGALLGGLTLLEHLAGWDLHIDQLLAEEPPGAPGTASPGRMGPPAASSFLLLGTALVLLDRHGPRLRTVASTATLATAFLSLLSLVGYAYGATRLFALPRYTGIALTTAAALQALAAATLLAMPRSRLVAALASRSPSGARARRAVISSALIPLAAGWLVSLGLRGGAFGGSFAIALLVLAVVFSLTFVMSRDAVRLDRAETARRAADEARDRSERELRHNEERFRRLVEVSAQIVWVTDARGEAIEDSPSWRAFTGRSYAQWAGWGWLDAVHPDDRERLAATWRAAVDAATPYQVEFRQLDARGEYRHLECRAVPIVDAGGGVREWIGMNVDITDRKRAEDALRASDARKGEFIAVLSHELRNPLTPIRNALALLERAPDGTDAAERARAVLRRQTEHLVHLVNDLLEVTRISRGRIQLRRTCLDARAVVQRTCEDHRSLFERVGVELRCEADGERPVWVDADATRLSQILGNLLQNAAKFTPPGGAARVSVRPGGGFAELRVSDDGIGLTDARRLFEPFGRAAQGPGNEKGGLGLGLAIVKGLAELHGGSVSAHSDGPGRGCEVTVRLPLAAGAPPAERAEAAAPPRPERRAGAPHAPCRVVLIVEDNVDAARSLADLLVLDGHRVEVACDGRSGIERARQLRPDAVVCDLGLPDVDGYDVARAIRADPSLEATRLIAISGYAQPEDRRRALEAGFRAHLAKPPSLEVLNALLAETAAPAATGSPTPTPTPTPAGAPGFRSR